MRFRFLEDEATADIAFKAFGKTREEMFSNSGLALFEIMVGLKNIDRKIKKKFSIESESLESLMFDFITEFLFLFDTKGFIFSDIEVVIKEEKEFHLDAICKGEKFDPKKHEIKSEVKAVSYYGMKIHKNKKWEVKITLDL